MTTVAYGDRPQWITKYKPTENFINDVSIDESNAVADHLVDLMYDRRFCYAHTWTTGEFLIADNIEVSRILLRSVVSTSIDAFSP